MISNGVQNAYTLLGLSFLIVFGSAYMLLSRQAEAPTPENEHLLSTKQDTSMALRLKSPAFNHNETIPSKYTCDGENISPPLLIEDVPEGTRSLVLVMDDPDIPQEVKNERGIEKFNHWAVYDLRPNILELGEGSEMGQRGTNSVGKETYTGPCPPPEYEPKEHRYIFRLYALTELLSFEHPPTLDELEAKAREYMIESAELIGRYSRVVD